MQTEEIINKIKNSLANLENKEAIDFALKKLEKMPEEELIKFAKNEQIIDQDGNINEYMLKRILNLGVEGEKKLEQFKKQYGKEGTKEEKFEYKNKLVMLELATGDRPIEMHVEGKLPEGLLDKSKTMLSTVGAKILTLSFCDALLKIGKEWNAKGKEWGDADKLVLSSFIMSNGTVKLLNDLDIGFDAKFLKLEPTNLKDPPKIKSKDITEEELEEIKPYIDRYSIHRDIHGKPISSRNIGFAKISKEDLTRPESLEKILLKMKELEKEIEQFHSSKGINIKAEEEKYGITSTLDEKTKSEKCYHMTSHLMEIMQDENPGLKPFVGDNSKLVNDVKQENRGISYSLGLEGIIVTNAMFRARYQYDRLENQTDRDVTLDDMFNQNVKNQEDMALGKNVYLTFDETEKIREENEKRDISDPKTKSPIDIKDIKGVILKNSKTGEIKYDRESIIRYAISKTNIENILNKMPKTDRPFMNMDGYAKTDFSFKQYVERYYEEISKDPEMIEFKNGEYELQEIDANELLKMVEHDKTIKTAQVETQDYENHMDEAEGKNGFDDLMESETKTSEVQRVTKDIREMISKQKEQTNENKEEQLNGNKKEQEETEVGGNE